MTNIIIFKDIQGYCKIHQKENQILTWYHLWKDYVEEERETAAFVEPDGKGG